MFHFLDIEKRLYQRIWEKYLLNNSLHASENFFFTIKVMYNGEEFVNTKLKNRIPLSYELYSDIEMNKIDYDIKPLANCQFGYGTEINLQVSLAGLIYNEAGNRAIELDGTRLYFQVAPFDTIKHDHPKDAKIFRPPVDKINPREDFLNNCLQLEDVNEGEVYGFPCLRWKNKPYVINKKAYMVFKLPHDAFEKALALEGTLYFNPNGREAPSDEWIQIPYYYLDVWPEFADIALEYVKQ